MGLSYWMATRPLTRISFKDWHISRSRIKPGVIVSGTVLLVTTTNMASIKEATCKVYLPTGVRGVGTTMPYPNDEVLWPIEFNNPQIEIPREMEQVKVRIDVYTQDGSHNDLTARLPVGYRD